MPPTALLKAMAVIEEPEQIVCDDGLAAASGVGFTTTVAVIGVPSQPLLDGVMVNVTVTGALVVFTSVAFISSPLPLAPMPVTATLLSLVQVKVVPETLLFKSISVMDAPEQIICADGLAVAFGVGSTKTVAATVAPVHPFNTGETEKVTVTGANVVLVNAPDISPLPLAAMPVTETLLFLVQLNKVDGKLPVNAMVEILPPEQMV